MAADRRAIFLAAMANLFLIYWARTRLTSPPLAAKTPQYPRTCRICFGWFGNISATSTRLVVRLGRGLPWLSGNALLGGIWRDAEPVDVLETQRRHEARELLARRVGVVQAAREARLRTGVGVPVTRA